jgi:hypothetical protein
MLEPENARRGRPCGVAKTLGDSEEGVKAGRLVDADVIVSDGG